MSAEQPDHVQWSVFMPKGVPQVQKKQFIDLERDHTLDLSGGYYKDYANRSEPITSYIVRRADGSSHAFDVLPYQSTTTFGQKVELALTRSLSDSNYEADVVGGVIVRGY